ncbi:LysR substrate-binding domain-containing protein [Ruegeria lacuscaerulensis]|uniref:LysR substrate-binding domain-containing protein n=1 Tax=Ruegeria lacuscaerulensis TaxID=55218 RepID=UPI001F19DAA0|nr:LysR substrate-binding domain-containing protein [Ruegeria lacuscaerulensis]
MLNHYPRLQRSFPHLQINLSVEPLGITQLEKAVDFDIRLGANPNPDWHSDLLLPEDICLAGSPDFVKKHGLTGRKPLIEELVNLPLLHLDQGEYGIHWIGSYFAEFDISYAPDPATMYFNSYPHLVQAATEGRGLCLLWRHLNGGALEDGDLVEIQGTRVTGQSGYYLTCRIAAKNEPGFSNVRRWMMNACQMTIIRSEQ